MDASSEDKVRETIQRVLTKPLQDEDRVLEIIVDAITNRYTDKSLVERAVRQAVANYEVQMRIYMIAIAKAQLRRIQKLMNSISTIEENLTDPVMLAKIAAIKPEGIIQLYANAQRSLRDSLAYIKTVVDQRLEVQTAEAALIQMQSNEGASPAVRALLPQQRDKVRRILDGVIERLEDADADITAKPIEEMTYEELEAELLDLPLPSKGNGDSRLRDD